MEELIMEIGQLPEHMQEEVKDFVHFLQTKLANGALNQPAKKARKAGFLKGTFKMAPDFDEPLEDFKEYM